MNVLNVLKRTYTPDELSNDLFKLIISGGFSEDRFSSSIGKIDGQMN